MTVVVGVLLVIATLAIVVYPLARPVMVRGRRSDSEDDEPQGDEVASLLEELELDCEIGNTPEEEYESLVEEYSRRPTRAAGSDDEPGFSDDDIEREILRLRQRRRLLCFECGAGYDRGNRYCPECGARLAGDGRES